MKDLVIIGAGPAGLSAALYAARAGIDFLLIESNYMAGGQVLNTYEVDNYLGMPKVNGFDMGMQFKTHVESFGVEIVSSSVEKIEKKDKYFVVHTNEEDVDCKTILLATGAVSRKLGIPGEEALRGRGVGYCATCDGAFYRGRVTAVIGGSYQAVEDAIYLSAICEKVYLVHRRDALRAGAVLEKQLLQLDNVEIIWNHIPVAIVGNEQVEALRLEEIQTGKESVLPVDGVFVAVGTKPTTALAEGLVEMDAQGYIVAGEMGETSLPGFFVAGDIRTKALRQIVTAVADGANAITSVSHYLKM